MESLGHKVVPIDVVPRSPDLSLLGIKTPSHIMNVTDAAAFRELCEKEKPTHIFHAAHPPRNEDPSVINYCYHAMTNILEAAKEFGMKRVVYSSSASIYGQLKKPDGSLVKEEDAVYDLSHLFLPRRENRFRMDGRLLQRETRRRFRRPEILVGLRPGPYTEAFPWS